MTTRLTRALAGALLGSAVLATMAPTATAAPAAPVRTAALPAASDTNFGEARILWLLNEERRIRGLPPVQRNAGADMMAQFSADTQAWYGRLGHNPNLGRDVSARVGPWWYVGENVGCGADADNLHAMWIHSAGHRANMLQGAVETVGIGVAYARGCLWATVVFVDRR